MQNPTRLYIDISEHIFAAKLRLLCLLSISFKNWGISPDIPQFQLGNIRPGDAFRPIARERKYLMDYIYIYIYIYIQTYIHKSKHTRQRSAVATHRAKISCSTMVLYCMTTFSKHFGASIENVL